MAGAGLRASEALAPEESVTPGGLCLRRGRASRARCVTFTGSRCCPCQDIPRVSHGPAAPAAATSQPRPASCCPGGGSAACLPTALPSHHPGLREPSPPPQCLQRGDALGEAACAVPGRRCRPECRDASLGLSSLFPCQVGKALFSPCRDALEEKLPSPSPPPCKARQPSAFPRGVDLMAAWQKSSRRQQGAAAADARGAAATYFEGQGGIPPLLPCW